MIHRHAESIAGRRGTEAVITGAPRKRLACQKRARGFESHPLRQTSCKQQFLTNGSYGVLADPRPLTFDLNFRPPLCKPAIATHNQTVQETRKRFLETCRSLSREHCETDARTLNTLKADSGIWKAQAAGSRLGNLDAAEGAVREHMSP